MWPIRRPVLVLAMLVAVTLGCKKAEIVGFVRDAEEKPVSDAKVSIPNSAYEAQTDEGGKYTLAYAPGAFSVRFEKVGYITQSVSLNLTTAAPFEAQNVVLERVLTSDDAKRLIIGSKGYPIPQHENIQTGHNPVYGDAVQYVRVRSGALRSGLTKAVALADAGYLAVETIATNVPMASIFYQGTVDHVVITPTEKANEFLAGTHRQGSSKCNDGCIVFVTSTPQITISGITEPAESGGRMMSVVNYQLKWVNTPVGDVLGARYAPSEKTATFWKYDDGWRLEAD